MHRALISGAEDEDYFTKALLDYEAEYGVLKEIDAKRYKSSGSSLFNPDYEDASINLNVDGGDDEEDEVQEVERLIGREKAKVLK
ncbi:hypothetical protein Tco_1390909 [Tanacetum coccineum]